MPKQKRLMKIVWNNNNLIVFSKSLINFHASSLNLIDDSPGSICKSLPTIGAFLLEPPMKLVVNRFPSRISLSVSVSLSLGESLKINFSRAHYLLAAWHNENDNLNYYYQLNDYCPVGLCACVCPSVAAQKWPNKSN